MNIAIYARTATSVPDNEFNSLKSQVEHLNAWAISKGHNVAAIYQEIAPGNTELRTEFHRLIACALAKDHPFDGIAIAGLSRFSRNIDQCLRYKRCLSKAKVDLITVRPMHRYGCPTLEINLSDNGWCSQMLKWEKM